MIKIFRSLYNLKISFHPIAKSILRYYVKDVSADEGIAMGGVGSDTAIELSDIVLMNDDIIGVPRTYLLVKNIMKVVYENIFMSIGIKLLVLILSMFGISNMWIAVFSDVGVMIIAVLNSMRLMNANKAIEKLSL